MTLTGVLTPNSLRERRAFSGRRFRRLLGFRLLFGQWRRHAAHDVSPMDGVSGLQHEGGGGPRLQPDDFDLGKHHVRVLGCEGEPAAWTDYAEAVSQRDAVRLTPIDVYDFRLRGDLARLLEVHDHSGDGSAGRLVGRHLWGRLERHHKIAW